MRPAARRGRASAAWAGGGLALFAFFLRISLGARVNSDGANNALQAWDMLHGEAWLEAHGLTHGIAGYWDASVVTMQSGDRVQIRAVNTRTKNIFVPYWETNALWYSPSRYDARFVVADHLGRYPPAAFEQHFGRPAATYRVASWFVLIYRTNLLQQLEPFPSQLVPARASPPSSFEWKTHLLGRG